MLEFSFCDFAFFSLFSLLYYDHGHHHHHHCHDHYYIIIIIQRKFTIYFFICFIMHAVFLSATFPYKM